MSAKTLDEFWGINEDDDNDYDSFDEVEPDLTDYKAFEEVLSLTSNDARQQFIRDLLNTTTEMQKEQAERLKINNGRHNSTDNKPPWLKNTSRPGCESIHDHFLRYKQATQSNTQSVNNSLKKSNKTITERPLTRGEFFDDVVTQLFEGNNNMKYDDLDLTDVQEVQDPDFDNNYNNRKVAGKDSHNDEDVDDEINIRKPPNFIGSIITTEIMKQRQSNNKNTPKIQRTTITSAITSMQNNECRKNIRNLQKNMIVDTEMENQQKRVPPHLLKTVPFTSPIVDTQMENQQKRVPPHLLKIVPLSSQASLQPSSPLQRSQRPVDLFTRMTFGHDQTERDIIFQNSDEEDDYAEE